jgi:hypothetical protein
MRVRARAAFVEALGNAHRWLDELTHSDRTTLEQIEEEVIGAGRREGELLQTKKDGSHPLTVSPMLAEKMRDDNRTEQERIGEAK